MATITLQTDGRRVYFVGNTYAVRDALRNAGAHWDPQRKAWWTGKKSEAEEILASLTKKAAEATDGINPSDKVIRGRATYRGKTYYILAMGHSQSTGKPYCKLCFRDGSKTFWVSDPSQVTVVKSYEQPKSINALLSYAEQAKSDEYRTENYRIDKRGVHWVRVSGPRGWYWTEASKHDEFDEFDN